MADKVVRIDAPGIQFISYQADLELSRQTVLKKAFMCLIIFQHSSLWKELPLTVHVLLINWYLVCDCDVMSYIGSVFTMSESTMLLTIGGFEPATSYTKTDCLTRWRYSKSLQRDMYCTFCLSHLKVKSRIAFCYNYKYTLNDGEIMVLVEY